MPLLKRICALGLCLFSTGIFAGNESTLVIAADERFLPPYSCDSKTPDSCILMDMFEALIGPDGPPFRLQPMPESRQYIELSAGRVHIAMIFTTASLELTHFPNTIQICEQPAYSVPLAVFVRRDSSLEITGFGDLLTHHAVGVRLPQFQRKMIGGHTFKRITRVNTLQQVLRTILAGRADYALYELHSTQHMIKKLGLEGRIHRLKNLLPLHYHAAVSKAALANIPLLGDVCQAIERLKQQGTIQRILNRHTRELTPDAQAPAA